MSPNTDPSDPLYHSMQPRDVNKDETDLAQNPLMFWILAGLFGGLMIINLLIM